MDWFSPEALVNPWVALEPLSCDHAEVLWPTVDSVTFRYWVTLQPNEHSLKGFREFLRQTLEVPRCVSFAVKDVQTGEWVGKTSFMDIRDDARGVEIGMTWLGQAVRNTHINSAMKHLMLSHAFEDRRAIRVQLKTDARNIQSARAIAKLGALEEGVLRRHGIQPDGTVRDTRMFSIVDHEWPAVSKKLLARIFQKVGA